jgi:serine/threonine protein phosphatase PrpC
MSQPKSDARKKLSLKSASVTDRGLSPKRPLNEDSFLADGDRGIFAVADGVGGAEAGEVASQTAIEVLDEAFRHHEDGGDVEDLMELAIQRANASIHQMAQEQAKFAMMATTIVCLHLDGNVAIIGHVGDSRLYRLTPAGQLLRETEDHSVVEEEVRAGRMTAEQAANHPSKNVISRALGAESDVEVDLKILEVDDGTEFLLCTDGITRHIPDHEIRQVMLANDDLSTVCAELKQRCFERGAEDNLTAVLVSVGTPISAKERAEDLEKTISPETDQVFAVGSAAPTLETPATDSPIVEPFVPASRKAFPGAVANETLNVADRPLEIPELPHARSGVERTMTRFFLFVLLLGALAAAFYAGRRYRGPIPYVDQNQPAVAVGSPAVPTPNESAVAFETRRAEVDADPNAWLANGLRGEMTRQGIQNALDSTDPSFLCLYWRASLLAGDHDEAVKAFEATIARADINSSPANASVRREAALGLAAVALQSDSARPAALRRWDEVMRKPSATPSVPVSTATASPLASP